jgi:anti-sigma28 factor (negative regulator of flagellin synthesis)
MITNSFSIAPLSQSMNEHVPAPQVVAEDQAVALAKSRASLARQIAIKRGLLASKRPMKQREARILYLRSQIEAGVYRVSSAELAARLLENWTHFLDEP